MVQAGELNEGYFQAVFQIIGAVLNQEQRTVNEEQKNVLGSLFFVMVRNNFESSCQGLSQDEEQGTKKLIILH
ncbi:hypothetical protein JCM31598_06960 [Desulfonatronum parangueonense]